MSIVRGLFLSVAGAIACSIPWQDTANVDGSAPIPGNLSITPTGGSGADGTPSPAQASSSTGASPDIELVPAPASAPEIATLAPRTALGARQLASLPSDRGSVARDLQRELTRVGCYDGEIHGVWTPAARRAMKAFTDRVNATLPTDEPDYILLSLVQAARDKVCGAGCPAGQGFAEGGRCVPNAILAGKKISVGRARRSDPGNFASGKHRLGDHADIHQRRTQASPRGRAGGAGSRSSGRPRTERTAETAGRRNGTGQPTLRRRQARRRSPTELLRSRDLQAVREAGLLNPGACDRPAGADRVIDLHQSSRRLAPPCSINNGDAAGPPSPG